MSDALTINTTKPEEVIDITDQVAELIQDHGLTDGLINLFIKHTTAALTVADLDPGTDLDLLDAYRAMVPKLNYRHPHDPSHVSDHILSALIGVALTVPINSGRLELGQWQRIVLIEFSGPRARQIGATLISA